MRSVARQHSDELSVLSRQLAELKASQGKMSEEARATRSQVLLLEEQCTALKALEERLASTRQRLSDLEEQPLALEALKPLPVSSESLLPALEERLELVVSDLKRQLERQIGDLNRDEPAQGSRRLKAPAFRTTSWQNHRKNPRKRADFS